MEDITLTGCFGIATIWLNFQSAGSLPDSIERLNRDDTEGATDLEKVCSIHADIPSGPVEEWDLIPLIRSSASPGVQSSRDIHHHWSRLK